MRRNSKGSVKNRAEARIHFRLNAAQRALIDQAASLQGQSLTDFATAALVERAREILERERVTRLSARDSKIFLAILDSHATPNAALRRAARAYRRALARRPHEGSRGLAD